MKIFLCIMAIISFLVMMSELNPTYKKVYAACFIGLTIELTAMALLPYFIHEELKEWKLKSF